MLAQLRAYGRFARGLSVSLGRPISLDESRAAVASRLLSRETLFLDSLRSGVFGDPQSPYRPLFDAAGWVADDVERLVRDRGLEPALEVLREGGVYISFEEFKGRRPIVRGGREISAGPHAFDNRRLTRYISGRTGGTTGAGVRTAVDLDHLREQATLQMLALAAHQVLDAPTAVWRTLLPSTAGINTVLRGALIGNIPERWFCPLTNRQARPSLKDRLATQYILRVGRLAGAPLPSPEWVPFDRADLVLEWVVDKLRARGRCLLRAHVSMLLRVALAARERSADLTGAVFMGGGEPPSPAKVAAIEALGARFVPNYAIAEIGAVGFGCARPAHCSDVHFFSDSLALIRRPRPVPGAGVDVDAFLFTTLLPNARKRLINVEMDDYGVVERRSCGCPLEACGFPLHIREVQSFSKLTGEGVTLVGGDLVRLLDQVLPERFGGTSQDYQLLEEEDAAGLTRLVLLVHPRLDIPREGEMLQFLEAGLGGAADAASRFAGAVWRQARTFQLRRAPPVWTAEGKLQPLVKIGPGRTAPGAKQ